MNAAEKKVVRIAIFLFAVGTLVRFAPWGLPAIENVDIADRQKHAQTGKVSGVAQSRLEYGEQVPAGALAIAGDAPESGEKKAPKRAKKKKAVVHFPLRINAATADELCALKGVGPKLADKIIAFREANGPFGGPSSLQKVPGIGKKKLEGILPWVIFD
jgi:competence protein ComEA